MRRKGVLMALLFLWVYLVGILLMSAAAGVIVLTVKKKNGR